MDTELKIELRQLADLREFPGNPRTHPERQIAALRQSIRRHGIVKPIVIRPDGTILAGHGLVIAARAEALMEVPVSVYDRCDADCAALVLADNRIAQLADDDGDALERLLAGLRDEIGGVDGTGWDAVSISEMIEKLGFAKPIAPAPAPAPAPARTMEGETWAIGRHRVHVGDARRFSVTGDIVFTDPPFELSGDAVALVVTPIASSLLLCAPLRQQVDVARALSEWRCGESWWLHRTMVSSILADAQIRKHGILVGIYRKDASGPGVSKRRHIEMSGDRSCMDELPDCPCGQADHQQVDECGKGACRGKGPYAYRYAKCTHALRHILSYFDAPIVVDPFCGSGSVLLSADALGRTAIGCELLPHVADLSIARLEQASGQAATRIATGYA